MVIGGNLCSYKGSPEWNERQYKRNIVSRTIKQSNNRNLLNSSQESHRKKSGNESLEYGSRSKKESLYRDSMFVLYKIAPQIQIQINDMSTCMKKIEEPEIKKCSKFFIKKKVELPSFVVPQPTREVHSILRTPYSKGYEIFKEHANKNKDARFVRRKYSEYK
jgi:hypothetical protein